MAFINDRFLLGSQAAIRLFEAYAADEPIFDYHCHLSPEDLANNRQFDNLHDIWLEGDHYKWRAMRLNGIDERYCTGDAGPFEKFKAFAQTVPHTLRNPIYHWTHLELARYFGVHERLDADSAASIWERANAQLAQPELSSWGILNKQKVRFIGTTDDPVDTLEHHLRLQNSACPAVVAPTFRPDKALMIGQRSIWEAWIERLGERCSSSLSNLDELKQSLVNRLEFFATAGCRASDHGLERCPLRIASGTEAARVYEKARSGGVVSTDEAEGYAGHLLAFLGEEYARLGWVMQLHLGAVRNVNTALFDSLGPDIGCDSIGDSDQIGPLALLLGELSKRSGLPKTILYNLNPSANYAFATMCGNFFEAGVPHKVQFGSGWWFLDQWDGMKWQLNALSRLGLLTHFVGMLTDSRSMMSFPRHEYFRRLLCHLIGADMEAGVLPNDDALVGTMVRKICFSNAKYFFEPKETSS